MNYEDWFHDESNGMIYCAQIDVNIPSDEAPNYLQENSLACIQCDLYNYCCLSSGLTVQEVD